MAWFGWQGLFRGLVGLVCGLVQAALGREGEVWEGEGEGSEVATRGKPAADFKPARPQLNSNWVRSRNKKDWSSDAALDFKQSNIPQPWKDVILILSEGCSDDQLCSVANFGHFNIQLSTFNFQHSTSTALTNYWLQTLIQLKLNTVKAIPQLMFCILKLTPVNVKNWKEV